ncbi:Uncharacterised protein [Raoultella ornithinolytica]|uniref:Uncharacterized protein n=1 Tax=Raoultella ornithinolytica TaxID=54291 RepID=A0A7G9A667_RAOOR|nr:hypothetical protein HMPREF9690_05309 [Raoultella ornithinolytica 10-5246]QNL32246.1 Hypothetical protein [Raoultella ornithinolytica]VEC75559.1 Uncharacterised protein [Raoultella ornithinolytica]
MDGSNKFIPLPIIAQLNVGIFIPFVTSLFYCSMTLISCGIPITTIYCIIKLNKFLLKLWNTKVKPHIYQCSFPWI